MDQVSIGVLSGLISGVVDAGSGAAISQLRASLAGLCRRGGVSERVPGAGEQAEGVARELLQAADRDSALAQDLEQWLKDAGGALANQTVVTNSISGVVVGGSVTQTGISTTQ